MKTTFVAIIGFLCFSNLYSQQIVGSWAGELAVSGTKLPLIFNIMQSGTDLVTTMDSPSQGAKDMPTTKTSFIDNQLIIDASNFGITFKGKFENETITGSFLQGGASFPLTLSKNKGTAAVLKRPQTPQPPFNYIIEDVTFTNPIDKNTLAGTLTMPNVKQQVPIVILISGSGQQNRNSELFGHKPFWVIADDFAKKGIGVLRIDDRGTGGSNGISATVTTQNFAGDINAAVEFLAQKGYKKIGLIGHSEGGIIAPMVASQNPKVKFIITMAGAGVPTDELLMLQTNAIAKASGASDEELKSAQETNRKMYDLIKNYKGNDLKGEVKKLFIAEMQNLPKEQQPPADEIDKIADAETQKVIIPWFEYFLKINPDVYLSKLKIPVLAINGTKDLQVISKENLAGIKASLEKAKNKKFEIVEFPNLNHLFQEAKTGTVEEYGQLEQTIAPQVLDKMSSWILKN
ncbi:alpha/beta hydrolase family protein [Flavobacterium wongokense]|uniref:alpha/beta hydrolase family protein n=1 Tax=Flavobacterium wongokense TaxID=2910674 RepID=UPI001F1C18C4|nr:alpha/beta hydrolase [Flavobacterium sp. WG47]MCF6131450.1 alpha/beta hydrolase [Flavobacterium sp. WG47]